MTDIFDDIQQHKAVVADAEKNGGAVAAEFASDLLPKLSVDRMVSAYIRLRDARAAATAEYERADKDYAGKLKTLETAMLVRAQEEGVSGFKTDYGTTYIDTTLKCSGADWGAFYTWMRENDAIDFLERRIKSTSIKQYMEEHDGAIPPGVTVFKELVMKVRRK